MKVFQVISGISMEDLQNAQKGAKEAKEGQDEPMQEEPPMPQPKEEPIPPKQEETKPKAEDEEIMKKRKAEEEKMKGNEAYKAKKFSEAQTFYDNALVIYPKEPVYHLNKASVYLEQKMFEKVLEECDEAIKVSLELMPRPLEKIAKAYARKGNCFVQMSKLPEAIEMYDKSLLEMNDHSVREAKRKAEQLIHTF
jgi:stress-induced-phosphoprotein 1